MTEEILAEVAAERQRQTKKFGVQNLENGTSRSASQIFMGQSVGLFRAMAEEPGFTWRDVLLEEVAEALEEKTEARLREELIQVAAVAVAWVEAIERKRVTAQQLPLPLR